MAKDVTKEKIESYEAKFIRQLREARDIVRESNVVSMTLPNAQIAQAILITAVFKEIRK